MVDGRFSNATDLRKVKLAAFHLHAYRMQKITVQCTGNESKYKVLSCLHMLGVFEDSAQMCSIS